MARSKLSEDTVERLLKCQRWGVYDEGSSTGESPSDVEAHQAG
jgi:hypothetical protein